MKPRDITKRVLGRPLRSPFAPGGGDPTRGRWIVAGVALWLLWVTVISEHSLWRIVQLKRELVQANRELGRVTAETEAIQASLEDPITRREQAERVLRTEQGWSRPGEIIYRVDEEKPGGKR